MITKVRQAITRNLLNIPGWRTRRKIVVFESDDWGSIRMASPEAYQHFLNLGYPVDQCPYNRYDMLESNRDLEALYEVLDSVRDINRRPAILTANSLVANPDFDKIEADNFTNYHYEILTDTLKRYPDHDRVFDLYHQGIESKLIKPQFHGREHLNIGRWMKALQDNDQFAKEAFRFNMFSVHPDKINDNGLEYMEALDYDDEAQLKSFNHILVDGAGIFKQLWGYTSTTFIASCYIWPEEVEPMLSQTGVKYLQGTVVQAVPRPDKRFEYTHKYHFLGQRNKFGQRYLVRNAFFEPSHTPYIDNVGECLKRISIAFKWNKPAIISTHRLNFMGSLDPANRSRGLKTLAELLKRIVAQWPDVEFLSSDELGDIMNGNESR
ncbi:hypothetical protein DSECCO2_253580 [anaerobic digester metagenome]